jgi:isopenicillin N synthase-like dioxygenase
MMRWTNDLFVSTKHRVVDPPPKSDQPQLSQERYSIAFFVHPDDDCVGMLTELIVCSNIPYLSFGLNLKIVHQQCDS